MIKRILYIIYLFEWRSSHRSFVFKGCTPVCYKEWQDCELNDMLKHPEWYEKNWYYPLVKVLLRRKK
jgi:hypothetical protein